MNFTRIGQNIFAFLSLKVKNFFSAKRERDKNIVERRRNPYEHGNLPPYKVQILYIACVLFYIYIFKIVNVFHVFITLLYQWCIITLLYYTALVRLSLQPRWNFNLIIKKYKYKEFKMISKHNSYYVLELWIHAKVTKRESGEQQ